MDEKKEVKHRTMKVMSTKSIFLSRSKPIQAVNLLLPPGIATFYVERLDKNHIRFIVPEKEISRIIDKKTKQDKKIKGEEELKKAEA